MGTTSKNGHKKPVTTSKASAEKAAKTAAPAKASPAKAAAAAKAAAPAKAAAAPAKHQAKLHPPSSRLPVAPVKPVAPIAVAAPVVKKPAPPPIPTPPKKLDFKVNDFIVYPAHGVGRIVSVEHQEVAGIQLELFVVSFDKDKMILRVPVTKARTIGMRKLASPDIVQNALNTLKGRARVKRTMWSRRAQEYEAKINSGDLISIAEVVRDLHRATGQPEQSYSERQLYEAALDRMAREVAAVERIDEESAIKRVETALLKAA